MSLCQRANVLLRDVAPCRYFAEITLDVVEETSLVLGFARCCCSQNPAACWIGRGCHSSALSFAGTDVLKAGFSEVSGPGANFPETCHGRTRAEASKVRIMISTEPFNSDSASPTRESARLTPEPKHMFLQGQASLKAFARGVASRSFPAPALRTLALLAEMVPLGP